MPVATENKCRIHLHADVTHIDVPELPLGLEQDLALYQQALALGERKLRRISNHERRGLLRDYRALEIDWEGTAYRLVYRVYDSPAPRRVVVLGFAEHDAAYERAIARRRG